MENNLNNCQFFVKRKKRYCRMTIKDGNKYCGEHMVMFQDNVDFNSSNLQTKRIICPIDNSHTCYESKLAKHLKVCNAKRLIDTKPEYIVKGINLGDVNLQRPQHIPLIKLDQSVIDYVINKVHIAYATLPEVNELILQHEMLNAEINNPIYGNNTKKHLIQNSSLLAHLERAKLIQENTCFIEFGAGKGKLTYWLAKLIDNVRGSTILLIDRSSHRHKNDNKLKNKECPVNLIRIRADIADLSLNKIDVINQTEHRVGIAKHLCGAATDLTIRCLDQLIREGSTIDGLVVAFCCHHCCDYISYVGKKYLEKCGFLPEEFPILCSIASWATCGTRKNREDSLHCNEESTNCPKLDERESIGRKVKGLLNWGRIEYLKTIGFNSNLYYYTNREVSLENMCVVATRI